MWRPLSVLLAVLLGASPATAFRMVHHNRHSLKAGLGTTRRTTAAPQPLSMAAVPAGGKVLVVGVGPVMLLAAKRAALEGYDTYVVTGNKAGFYKELLYSDVWQGKELPNLTLLEQITGDGEAEFDKLLQSVDGVIMAMDNDDAITEGLVDVVLPAEKTKVTRVVAMSRNLNGKGLGPLVIASKGAANREVWTCPPTTLAKLKAFEQSMQGKAAAIGADYVICRAGTLKGGGPGDVTNVEDGSGKFGLAKRFYKEGNQDIVNWRMLFDIETQGVVMKKGDTAEGPGFGGVFAATNPGVSAGDTGRVAMAGALVSALQVPEANFDCSVATAAARFPPEIDELSKMYKSM